MRRSKLFKVAVRLTALEPVGGSTGFLFGQSARDERLGAAMDAVNRKFGRDAIRGASMLPSTNPGTHVPPAFVVPARFRGGPKRDTPDIPETPGAPDSRGRGMPDGFEFDEGLDESW